MLEVKKLVEQMQKMGKAFQQSKIELLNNIRTRLRGWILQVIFFVRCSPKKTITDLFL